MTMTILWTGMVVLSILCGLATGQSAQVAAAAVEGTQAAVELCLSIAGMLCPHGGHQRKSDCGP